MTLPRFLKAIVVDGTIEELESSLQQNVDKIHQQLGSILTCIDTFLPHYQESAQASSFLSARTVAGMTAVLAARGNIETLTGKQRQIAGEISCSGAIVTRMSSPRNSRTLCRRWHMPWNAPTTAFSKRPRPSTRLRLSGTLSSPQKSNTSRQRVILKS